MTSMIEKPKSNRAKTFYNHVDQKGSVKQDSNTAASDKGRKDKNGDREDKFDGRDAKGPNTINLNYILEEIYPEMTQAERDYWTSQFLAQAENDDIIDYNSTAEEEDAAKKAWREYRDEQLEEMAAESKHLLDSGKISPELFGVNSLKNIRKDKMEKVTLDPAYDENDNGNDYDDTIVGMRITTRIQ